MSTGDLNGNLQRLLRELKAIKCPADVDEVGLRLGDPVALLPLLNFILLKFSRHVARFIVRHGFELAGKTDQRFVESCFKLFREVLNVRTVLTPAQFFEHGYAERKVLILCDVIAVCKKLHNEEVRQERLAALKATRQDQASSRLVAPRRSSPQVKVVRSDDIEIQQVLAPQHLPNASDGAQSVYKTKKMVSRSPSPSPGLQPAAAAAKAPSERAQNSPQAPLGSSQGQSLELTFRPLALANPGQVPQRQALAGSAAAQVPIRNWFMNPAFAEVDDASVDLALGAGMGLSATGRPDSSAWWRLAPSPPEQQAAAPSWRNGTAVPATDTGRVDAASDSRVGGELDSGKHLFFGRQPAVASMTAAASGGSSRQAASQQQVLPAAAATQQQPDRGALHPPRHGANAALLRKGGAAAAATSPTTTAGSSGAGGAISAGSSHGTVPARDLDEWSFSKFFGPGKVALRRRGRSAGGDDTDTSSQDAEDVGDGDAEAAHRDAGDAAAAARREDDLERDGPSSDQDHRIAGARSPANRPAARHATPGGERASERSPSRKQQQSAGASCGAPSGSGSANRQSAISGGVEMDWPAQLRKLEREMQQQLQQLQSKLVSAEEELEKTRSEARQTREALQARVTVLEGRVRFLECELELCIKRGASFAQDTSGPGSPGYGPPPPSPGGLAAEPSLSWRSPGRPRSSAENQHHHREQAGAAPAPSLRAADAMGQQGSGPGPVLEPTAPTASASVYPNRYEQAVLIEPPRAAHAGATANAISGLAAPGASHVREVTAVEAGAAGGPVGSRWDTHTIAAAAAPSAGSGAVSSFHAPLRDGAGGISVQPRPPAPVPGPALPQHYLDRLPSAAPVASNLSLLPGGCGAGYRGPPSFSTMPQPGFSFQPRGLMQQVASAAALPLAPAPPHQQLPLHQPGGPANGPSLPAASGGPQGSGSSHLYGASLGSAAQGATGARYAGEPPAAGDLGHGGLQQDAGNARATGHGGSSVDSGPRRPMFSGDEDAAVLAVAPPPGRAAAGVPDGGYLRAWRGPECAAVRAGGPGSILDAPAAVQDSADGRQGTAAGPLQPDGVLLQGPDRAGPVVPAAAAAVQQQQHGRSTAQPQVANLAVMPHAAHAPADQPRWASSANVGGTAEAALAAAGALAPPVVGGLGSGGGRVLGLGAPATSGASGGSRNTEDVISSLYLRYTEAQDFLQTLRKR